MSLISVPQYESLDDTSKKMLDAYKERTGMDHNLFKVLTHKPNILHAFANFIRSINENTTIDKSLSELIMVYVSKRNQTPYWGTAHSVSAKRLGMSNQKVEMVIYFDDHRSLYTDEELAVLEFTKHALIAGPNGNDCPQLRNVLKYLSESQVVEILFYINFMLCTNTINNTLNIQMPDELMALNKA